MSFNSLRLFTLLGTTFRAHPMWLPIAPAITITLALSVFPVLVPELPHATYWIMAVAGTVGVFASVLLRELPQAILARLRGLPALSITLHFFGGARFMCRRGTRISDELLFSAFGLATSLAVSSVLLVALFGTVTNATPLVIAGVMFFLAVANGGIALANLAPAYPFGTGGLLRSAVAYRTKSLARGNRFAVTVSILIGVTTGIVGMVALFRGETAFGIWLILLGGIVTWTALTVRREQSDGND